MRAILAGYLTALMFWFQVSLGSLGILLIHNLTGGRWGLALRPYLLRTLPTFYVLSLVFLPVLFFMPNLYPWAGPWARSTTDSAAEEFALRTTLMNPTFFAIRSIVYLTIWIYLARAVRSHLAARTSPSRLKVLSGAGLMALLFSVTFASMDWIMTLNAQWVSTGFGVVFISGCLVAGFSFPTIIAIRREREVVQPLLIDLGNLLLMAILFWAYMEFMQYLIIWSGQIPREIAWYHVRSRGGWLLAIAILALFHFAVPFLLLLFRSFKQRPLNMLVLSSALLVLQWLDCVLLVAPSIEAGFLPSIFASLVWTGVIGFVWFWIFNRRENGQKFVPYSKIAAEVGR